MLLIISIATFIGLIISVGKAIRFLKKEDTAKAKFWAIITIIILVVYGIVYFIYTQIIKTVDKITLSNNKNGMFSYKNLQV